MSDDEFATKRGIMNVGLCKTDISKTGYLWRYCYYEDYKIKYLSSRSLVKLRRMVLDKGFEWIITSNKNAIDSYKLDKQLNGDYFTKQLNGDYEKNNFWVNKSSGVRYVYKHNDKGAMRGFYWQYVNHNNEGQGQYSSKYLPLLKKKIDDLGFEWNIVDEELYSKIYEEELEMMKNDSYI